ncbi:hypothetical protein MMC30_005161 [Trapelia coarctata]|nr:hypothetical protein [Trapelia coarctata]
MGFQHLAVKPLFLIGGRSSRMGEPKHLLPDTDGTPMFEKLLRMLQIACPDARTVSISVRDRSQELDLSLLSSITDKAFQYLYDSETNDSADDIPDIGPAAGLLAAYREDPQAYWLVSACDYPLLQPTAIWQLVSEFEEPVTCFKNTEGYCEPLLAIWGPTALEKLKQKVQIGKTGPSSVVREMGGKMLKPAVERWLTGTNTMEEYKYAMKLAGEEHSDLA